MIDVIGQRQQWIEREIKKSKFGKQPESLYEPIRYLMGLGGKRLRPLLTLLAYDLYRDDVQSVVPYATAVEVFHNFTLMHDDIMDKAPLRRGMPTVHKKWNVNTAILSGDVMLVKVYEIFQTLDAGLLKAVLPIFNKCAAEVCEGQQWDMEFESRDKVKESEYINMIRLKTSVLLGFSLELGAVLAHGPEEDRQALYNIGVNLGIGFQLMDDVLDAYGDPKKFGKQVGGDIIANKKTWLLIKALEKSKGKDKKELDRWLSAKTFKKQEKVDGVKAIYDNLNIRNLAIGKANQYFDKGLEGLDMLPVERIQKAPLRKFAEQLMARQS